MNLFKPISAWLSEHASAASLRDNNTLLRDQKAALETQVVGLGSRLKIAQSERDNFKSQAEALAADIEIARQEIQKLNEVNDSLKDQKALEHRIALLTTANRSLETQLRLRTLGR